MGIVWTVIRWTCLSAVYAGGAPEEEVGPGTGFAAALPALVFGGWQYDFLVTAPPDEGLNLVWTLDYEGLRVSDGRSDGNGSITVRFPDVTVRTSTSLSLYANTGPLLRRVLVCPVDVVPSVLSPSVTKRMEGLRVAVYDDSGTVGRLMQRSGVRFVRVTQRYALDFFDGDLVVIGPGMLDCTEADLLDSLMERVGAGLHVALLPQGQAWSVSGVRQCRRPKPSGASCDESYLEGVPMSADELSDSIWVIERGEEAGVTACEPLMVIGDPPRALAARMPVGRGALWAVTVPSCRSVDDEPAGLLTFDRVLNLAVAESFSESAAAAERKRGVP